MEPEDSLPHSQEPATCPYPEPDRSKVHTLTSHFLQIHLNIILPSTPRSNKWSLIFRFPHQTLYNLSSPIRPTCAAHLSLLDLIIRTIFSEQYRSLSSSLCSFLHSPVTSSFLKTIFYWHTLHNNDNLICKHWLHANTWGGNLVLGSYNSHTTSYIREVKIVLWWNQY
jgi:hypothetical protein